MQAELVYWRERRRRFRLKAGNCLQLAIKHIQLVLYWRFRTSIHN
jgi:hypothetical protein